MGSGEGFFADAGSGAIICLSSPDIKDRHGFLPAGSGTSGKSEVLTRTQRVVTREVRKPQVVTTGTHRYEGTFKPQVPEVPSTFGMTGTFKLEVPICYVNLNLFS